MQQTISITSKWQIHIPKAARKALKLTRPTQARVRVEGKNLIVIPQESKILQLAGKFAKYAKGKNINIDKIRDYIDYSKA